MVGRLINAHKLYLSARDASAGYVSAQLSCTARLCPFPNISTTHADAVPQATADMLRRQHDAAAFLAVGAQNDAVEALELLAAAAEQEMRVMEQQHRALHLGTRDAGSSSARGLALLLDPPCREARSSVGRGKIMAAHSPATASPQPAPLLPSNDALNGHPPQRSTAAAAADVGGNVIVDGVTLAGSLDSTIQQATELLSDGQSAGPGSNLPVGRHDADGGATALPAGAGEPQQGAPARLPLQGLQAHELVCGRCGTPHETQLVPFFVLPLGASSDAMEQDQLRGCMRLMLWESAAMACIRQGSCVRLARVCARQKPGAAGPGSTSARALRNCLYIVLRVDSFPTESVLTVMLHLIQVPIGTHLYMLA